MFRVSLLLATCFLIAAACTKNRLSSSPDVQPTPGIDTLHFDTLFTQTGAATAHFLIYNHHNSRLRISNIGLGGGAASFFHINVNGVEGPSIAGIEINPHDSAHVFVNAYIPASAGTVPFIISDSIGISANGKTQWVQLDAWGQNAHFIRNGVINSNTIWKADLPYVITGPLVIAENTTLHIEKGARIYCHADAAIQVNGGMEATGGAAEKDRILFTGDRLDAPYDEYPASWPGIRFNKQSHGNLLQYVDIRNAYRGITIEAPAGNEPSLVLEQTAISNASDAGLFASGSYVRAANSVFVNCGKNIYLEYGGRYYFTHCSMATFSNNYFAHTNPVVYLGDSKTDDNGTLQTAALTVLFSNSIIWGESISIPDELVADRQGTAAFSCRLEHGIARLSAVPAGVDTMALLTDADPLFVSTGKTGRPADLHLQAGSPAIGLGAAAGVPADFDGKSRPVINPAAGAFEQQ
ncbi:MAG: hypothetical protein QM664_04380 [Flavihumibacter sp.]